MEKGVKRLIDITLDELDDFLLSRGYRKNEAEEAAEEKPRELRYGDCREDELIRGDGALAVYLGVSKTAIYNLKILGKLDGTYVRPTPHRYVYFKEKIDGLMYEPRVRKTVPAMGIEGKPAREGRR